MSNQALQNELDRLKSELRKAQQINAELNSELSVIEQGADRARMNLENFNAKIRKTLDTCNGSMQSSHQRVVDGIALMGDIEQLYTRFKNVELANKKIRAANNKKYYDFANYRTVRKIVQGLMDNLDMQMVSNQTILKSVEVQHLQVPDYWLTCVLLSIMAWRNDDKDLADRAMERAVRLDKKSCAIFYMLFNLRMEREEAALKWFRVYQECHLKGGDRRTFLVLFSLVGKTLADDVDERTKNEVLAFIKKVLRDNMEASGYSEDEMVSRILAYFDRMQPSDQLQYRMLRKCCGEFEQLSSTMMQAKNNINILEFILQTVNVPAEERNVLLKDYIDEVIEAPNQVEKDVYDEIAYNELVIRLEGEVETAKEQFAAEQARRESDLNLIAEMIEWIYEGDAQEVTGQIKLSMFTLTKMLQEQAAESHAARYRSQRKTQYPIRIDRYATVVNFTNEEGEQGKIDRFFTEQRDAELAKIKKWPSYLALVLTIAAVAAGCFFPPLLILALGGVGYFLYVLKGMKTRKKQIQQTYAEQIRVTSEAMRQLFEEFKQYQGELDEYDAYHARILDEIHKL